MHPATTDDAQESGFHSVGTLTLMGRMPFAGRRTRSALRPVSSRTDIRHRRTNRNSRAGARSGAVEGCLASQFPKPPRFGPHQGGLQRTGRRASQAAQEGFQRLDGDHSARHRPLQGKLVQPLRAEVRSAAGTALSHLRLVPISAWYGGFVSEQGISSRQRR